MTIMCVANNFLLLLIVIHAGCLDRIVHACCESISCGLREVRSYIEYMECSEVLMPFSHLAGYSKERMFEWCENLIRGPSEISLYIVSLCECARTVLKYLLIICCNFRDSCTCNLWTGSTEDWNMAAQGDGCFKHLKCDGSFIY
ncbi:unnamed protein product [Camellia sinensis]